MIFNTFENNDIDKWTTKIGIFGKSFNELGTAIDSAFKTYIDNIDNFDKDISFWDALKENLFSKDDNWIKNSLGEIVSKDNIDSYIEELDLDSAKEKVEEIFNFSTRKGDKGWQDYFNTLDDGEGYIVDVIKSTDDLSKLTGEDLVAANQKARASAIAHNNALKQQTLGAKAGQVALKGLAMAGNALASIGISVAIAFVTKIITSAINSEKEMSEAINNASETLDEQTSSLDSNMQKLSELRDELDNGNLSYEDAATKRSELIDIQSSLIKTYGEEAESIDLVNGSLEDQLGLLDEIKKQKIRDAVNAGNKRGWWGNFINGVGNVANLMTVGAWKALTSEAGEWDWKWDSDYWGTGTSISQSRNKYNNYSKKFNVTNNDEINKYIESFDNIERIGNSFKISGDADKVKDTIAEIQKTLKGSSEYAGDLEQRLTTIYNNASDYSDKWKNGNDLYYLDKIVNDDELYDYYERGAEAYNDYQKAVESGNEADKTTAIEDYQELLSEMEQAGVEKGIIDYIKSIAPDMQSAFNDYTFTVKIQPQLDDLNSTVSKDANLLNDFSADELSQKWEDLSNGVAVDLTEAQQQALLSLNSFATSYGYTLDELLAKLEELGYLKDPLLMKQEEAQKYITGNTNTDHVNSQQDANDVELNQMIASLSPEDLDLVMSMSIDEKSKIHSAADLDKWLKEQHEKELEIKVSTSIDTAKAADTTKDAFTALDKALADYQKNGIKGMDVDNLTALNAEGMFGSIDGSTAAYEEFLSVMQDVNSTTEEVQDAFDTLATKFLYHSELQEQITEENRDWVESELTKNGVTNASAVAEQMLINKYGAESQAIQEVVQYQHSLGNSKYTAADATNMLENASVSEIGNLINEANALGQSSIALKQYMFDKVTANGTVLNTDGDLQNLLALGEGIAGANDLLTTYIKLKAKMEDPTTKSGEVGALQHQADETYLQWKIKVKNGLKAQVKANTSPGGSYYKGSGDSGKSASDSAKEAQDTSKQYDWIAIAIQRCEEAITSLDRAEGNTYEWWSKRNKALLEEINQTAREIELLQYSYNGYMDAANAVGLSDDYKQKVINGTIQIETVTDENLQKKIDEFQQWWEKARDCKDKIDELNISLSKLAQQKFDNIVSHFEEREKAFTGLNDILDAQVKLAEAKGQIVSRKYYDAMIKNEQSNNKLLVQQRDQMVKSLNEAVSSGKIKQGSEAWYDMKAQIDAINKAIVESNTSLQEFQNSIRQLEWDKFDRLIEEIQDVADEIDWVSSLLKDDDLTDGKSNRGLTDKGNAKMGSYASMYNLYMAESQKYASEIKKIDKELAKDPYNQDLIDRKKELIKAQRDTISSAEDEKDAMIDLARKGYDAILESLQDLIDKKKEALESEKDLYEYQKSIAEKTKNIATLRKQLLTYENDNSEEAKKKVQQIRVDLEDAEQDLRDTEYDRWVSDQEEMMDNLYQDYSDKIDEKFENLEVLFQDLLKNVNDNSASISDTLKEAAKDAGYIVSDAFDTIFSGGKIASNFNGKFTTYQTTVQNALAEIVNSVTNMYEIAAKQAGVKVKQTKKAKGSADDKKEDKEQNTVKENLKWVAGKWAYEFVKSASIQTSDGSILTPVDTAQLDLTRGIDASLANISKSPILNMSNVSSNGSAGDVQLVIENITLPNVKDPKEFSEQLLSAMQNDKQVLKTMRAATIDLAVGKNSKRINRF